MWLWHTFIADVIVIVVNSRRCRRRQTKRRRRQNSVGARQVGRNTVNAWCVRMRVRARARVCVCVCVRAHFACNPLGSIKLLSSRFLFVKIKSFDDRLSFASHRPKLRSAGSAHLPQIRQDANFTAASFHCHLRIARMRHALSSLRTLRSGESMRAIRSRRFESRERHDCGFAARYSL